LTVTDKQEFTAIDSKTLTPISNTTYYESVRHCNILVKCGHTNRQLLHCRSIFLKV